MAKFNDSAAYSIEYLQSGVYYLQDGRYFTTQFEDIGTDKPESYQSMSSERSDEVDIIGGTIDGVTIGSNSTINAPISGPVSNTTITDSTITGGSMNGTPIGQTTPAAGAFTGLNATSAGILGPLVAEGVSSSGNAQAPSPTNSGITWGSSPTWAMQSFYDQTLTANNRTADLLWITNSIKFRFANDARNAFTDVFSISGGQASGVTGITSTSGSGDWAHTGSLSASGGLAGNTTVTAGIGSNSVQMVGAPNGQDAKIQALGVTDANVSLEISAKGTGLLKFASPASVAGNFTVTGLQTVVQAQDSYKVWVAKNITSDSQNAPLTLGAASTYFQVGGREWKNGGFGGIGFGYVTSVTTNPPIWIGWQEKTSSGFTTGDFIVATRSTGTDVAPTERFRITAAGDITATGVFDVSGGLRVKEGTNAKQGVATLVAGVVTVANTSVTANSRIFVQRQTDGGTVAASYSITRVAGTSFTITAKDGAGANNTTDTSVVAYQIFEPGA